MIVWFTGLSGSGKSTLSDRLKEFLEKHAFSVHQVDGDIVRARQNTHDKFSRDNIIENNLGIIEYCKKIQNDYDFIIVAVISPYQQTRDEARKTFGEKYLEIFLDCPIEELIKKDVKGIYKKAISGEITNFIGFSPSSPYERPQNPDITINTHKTGIESSLKKIISFMKS